MRPHSHTTTMGTSSPRASLYALLAANSISTTGNQLTAVAVPWFVLETTGSAARAGVVGFFMLLPFVIASVVGGVIVDRMGFWRMSISADVASGATVALIPLLYVTIGLPFWALVVLVFAGALLDAPGNTARRSLIPDLAEGAGMRLERANTLFEGVQLATILVGPVLAGFLIATLGASAILWIDAVTFGISALLVALGVPVLPSVILPVYAIEILDSSVQLGVLLSAYGAGWLAGTIAYGTVGHRFSRRSVYALTYLGEAVGIGVLIALPGFGVAVAALAFAGPTAGGLNPLATTIRQERTPVAMRGRVFGTASALAMGASPLGILLGGILIETVGLRGSLLAMTLLAMGLTIMVMSHPIFRLLQPPDDAGEHG